MLPTNLRQEALSRAHVRAVAAQAEVLCGVPEQDFGLDMFIRGVHQEGTRYTDTGPHIDLQVRSTTTAEVRPDTVLYDLDVRTYDLLRVPSPSPRILVLLVLPDDEAFWLNHSEEELILRRCLYWLSLREAEATANRATIRVNIPRHNQFSPEGVRAMMDRLREGMPL